MNFNFIPNKGLDSLLHGDSIWTVKNKLGEADDFDVWQQGEGGAINIHLFYGDSTSKGYPLRLCFSQDENFLLSQITVTDVTSSINGEKMIGRSTDEIIQYLNSSDLDYDIESKKTFKYIDPHNRRSDPQNMYIEDWDILILFDKSISIEVMSCGSNV